MLSTFLVIEGTAILLMILMLKLPTERGTEKELIHSQVFDKAVISILFVPILFGIYYLYKTSTSKIFLVLDIIIFIFFCMLIWYDTVKVTEMHNKNIEKDKKKKKAVYVRPVKEQPVKTKEMVEKEIEARHKERETSGDMSIEEVMALLREERDDNKIDWNKVAKEAAAHAKS